MVPWWVYPWNVDVVLGIKGFQVSRSLILSSQRDQHLPTPTGDDGGCVRLWDSCSYDTPILVSLLRLIPTLRMKLQPDFRCSSLGTLDTGIHYSGR